MSKRNRPAKEPVKSDSITALIKAATEKLRGEGATERGLDVKHTCDPIEIRDLKDWVAGRLWRRDGE